MPFGLCNAPATFQQLMTKVLGDVVGCTVYLDDVVVYFDTWFSHLERLTVNPAKCEFARAAVVAVRGLVRPVQEKN